MSKAQLDKFISLVSNDPSVLEEASKGAQEANLFIKNVVQYAKEHGYDFTAEEAQGWIGDQAGQRSGGELSDAQLEMVAGGKSPQTKQFLSDLTGFLDSHLKSPAQPAKPPVGFQPPVMRRPPFPRQPPRW